MSHLSCTQNIAVVINPEQPVVVRLFEGFFNYIQNTRKDWRLIPCNSRHHSAPKDLGNTFDGAIALPPYTCFLERQQFPTVLIRDQTCNITSEVSCVEINQSKVISIGVEHLSHLGLKRIHFLSDIYVDGMEWLLLREKMFGTACKSIGAEYSIFRAKSGQTNSVDRLIGWLKTLAYPCGVLAANDSKAMDILEAASILGISIPDKMAVVGIDNHPIIARYSTPTLTSISLNYARIGYVAAELLDGLITSRDTTPHTLRFSDMHLYERESSNAILIQDPLLQRAVDYISQHFNKPDCLEGMYKTLGASSVTINRRFKQELSCTAVKHLALVRIRKSAYMLKNSTNTIKEIAFATGFNTQQYFTHVFRRYTGKSPKEWRYDNNGISM
ncbi:substrate-binding domain-containing protein [Kiritimatiella glycovorans]|uniref:AraC family transcriptional regulator n=1 Tax=Kiritimatiella glycovorans TaxID=1307763 RepID=A0A0G3EG30_9BACT|nr:substrate-binding domain-containing protein [Kiritimatiella glycovorans]AKJ64337.1 AraC family transcriptional regulator [Kiritimatiella glycovorans]